jgi:hypothetical protein
MHADAVSRLEAVRMLMYLGISISSAYELVGACARREPATLLVARPLIASANAFMARDACFVCGRNTKMMCSGCRRVPYCSLKCELDDKEVHACDEMPAIERCIAALARGVPIGKLVRDDDAPTDAETQPSR